MSNNQLQNEQETLLQTIKARFERNKRGDIEAVFDANGPWVIKQRIHSGLVRYFKPVHSEGFDPYGNDTAKQIKQ